MSPGAMYAAVLAVAVLFAGLRLWGVKAQWFQAVAHLFVGGLLTASWWLWGDGVTWRDPRTWPYTAHVAAVLSAVELGRFLWDKFRSH